MSLPPSPADHPALETLDAAPAGLHRDAIEPTAIWLAMHRALHSHVEITPANGKPASSDEVLADLYHGLSSGYVRVQGEHFVLTSAGAQALDHASRRASDATRQLLASAPSCVNEILAAVESELTS